MHEIKIAQPRSTTDFPQMAYWLLCVEALAPVIMIAVVIISTPIMDAFQLIFLALCFFMAAIPVFSLLKKTRTLQQETRTPQQQVNQLREKMAILRNEDLDLS